MTFFSLANYNATTLRKQSNQQWLHLALCTKRKLENDDIAGKYPRYILEISYFTNLRSAYEAKCNPCKLVSSGDQLCFSVSIDYYCRFLFSPLMVRATNTIKVVDPPLHEYRSDNHKELSTNDPFVGTQLHVINPR